MAQTWKERVSRIFASSLGIVIISSIKTGEGKAAHIVVDQEAFASVVNAQEEEISANVAAAEDTATDIKMGRQVQTTNLHSAYASQNSGFALLAILMGNGVQGPVDKAKAYLRKTSWFL